MKSKKKRAEPEPRALEHAIGADDLSRVPFGAPERSNGGAKAAEEALPSAEPEPSSSSTATLETMPASDGSGALALVEMALEVSVAYMAKRSKIPAAAVADLRKLDEDERELLRVFAPGAEPYLGLLAGNSPKVAAVLFAAGFALIAYSRLEELRERAKRSRPAPEKKPERDADLHRATFGPAAGSIPRETRIVDSGFPPPFTPSSSPARPLELFTSSPNPLAQIA